MLFFDTNSWLTHRELNEDIKALKRQKEYYNREIKIDQKKIQNLKTEKGVEKLAREAYYMKRPDEVIYLIEYQDSIKTKK